jgi:hypothetical protein
MNKVYAENCNKNGATVTVTVTVTITVTVTVTMTVTVTVTVSAIFPLEYVLRIFLKNLGCLNSSFSAPSLSSREG